MTDATTAGTTERLFAEFEAPTLEQWREEVIRLLKGAPFEKKMLASTYEGITLQPIYTAEDVKGLPFQDSLPGEWPYLRGTEPLGKRISGWLVAQELPFPEAKAFNEALRQDLERGQNAVNLMLDEAGERGFDADQAEASLVGLGGTSISTFADMVQALEGVDPDVPLAVVGATAAVPAAALAVAALKAKKADLTKAELCFGFDPVGTLACHGTLPMTLDQAYDQLADLTKWAVAECTQGPHPGCLRPSLARGGRQCGAGAGLHPGQRRGHPARPGDPGRHRERGRGPSPLPPERGRALLHGDRQAPRRPRPVGPGGPGLRRQR